MFGLSIQIFSSVIIRFINETVPFQLADTVRVIYVLIVL